MRGREGRYRLHTNLRTDDPELLWRCCLQMVFVEEAFRTFKRDLGLRPIYHHGPAGSKRTCPWPSWRIA